MIDRRKFIANSSLALGAGLLGGAIFAAASRSKRIRIGAQTNTYGVPIKTYDHLLEILDELHAIGYQAFETSDGSLDPLADRAAECRKGFESHHVPLLAPHVGAKLWDRQTAPAEIEKLRKIATYTAQMGGTHMILSGSRYPRVEGKPDLDKVHIINEGLNAVGKMCKEQGLKFCYHNHVQEFQDDPPQMDYILKETDPKLVWLNFDIGNPYPTMAHPETFSKEHYKRIAVYHMKDVDENAGGKQVGTDFGAGKLDLKAVVQPILNSDWEGWLVVEREGAYPKPAEHPEVLLKQCREYLKQITSV